MSLTDDILVPKQSPLGVLARNLPWIEEELFKWVTEHGEIIEKEMKTNAWQILFDKNHNDGRQKHCAFYVEYLRQHYGPSNSNATPLHHVDSDSSSAPTLATPPAEKKSDGKFVEHYSLKRYAAGDYVVADLRVLFAAVMLQQLDYTKLPKGRQGMATAHFPDETLVDGLGVDLPDVKGPRKHVTVGRIQRALQHTWVLSPGPHVQRHDEILVRIGSPFDINVLTWRCTASRQVFKVPIVGLAVEQPIICDESLTVLNVYEQLSARWVMETLVSSYNTFSKVLKDTNDDVI